jgi:polyhydroxyalkanoate synthase
MPLFLDMVRCVAQDDADLAARALAGVRVYAAAVRDAPPPRPVIAQRGRVRLLGVGDSGPPVVLVPSLINPARVLDLREGRSLLAWLGAAGFRAMLLDWGHPDATEAGRDIAGHVESALLPLLDDIGEPAHLVGYCLGGTMTMAAAALRPVRSLALLATPWRFAGYPDESRAALMRLWQENGDAVEQIGLMPIELLQTAFWSLDPQRTVAKYAALAGRAADDPHVAAFAALEDWANEGAPLTAAAGRDLLERFVGRDDPGLGAWRCGDVPIDPAQLPARAMQFVAHEDRIAPARTASDALPIRPCPSGHVGMIVGGAALEGCWKPLRDWLVAT